MPRARPPSPGRSGGSRAEPDGPPKRRRRRAGAAPPASTPSAPGPSADGSSALGALLPGPYVERVPDGGASFPDPESTVVILPQGVEVVRLLARNAHPLSAIAATLGVCRMTLAAAMERQPEARAAFEEGRAHLEAECAGRVLQHARNGTFQADMFMLKTMFRYRETGSEPPRDGPKIGIQINLPRAMTEEEYARLIEVQGERPLIEVRADDAQPD